MGKTQLVMKDRKMMPSRSITESFTPYSLVGLRMPEPTGSTTDLFQEKTV